MFVCFSDVYEGGCYTVKTYNEDNGNISYLLVMILNIVMVALWQKPWECYKQNPALAEDIKFYKFCRKSSYNVQ